MGVYYEYCDMCRDCYADCGDNVPMEIEGSDKKVCPDCMEKHLKKKGIEITYWQDEDGDEYEMYLIDICTVREEYNPFADEVTISKEQLLKLKKAVNEMVRGSFDRLGEPIEVTKEVNDMFELFGVDNEG